MEGQFLVPFALLPFIREKFRILDMIRKKLIKEVDFDEEGWYIITCR